MFGKEAGTTAEVDLGVWTDDDKDPIAEINAVLVALATQTGIAKIDLVVGLNALEQIGKHPKVQGRFPGAQLINVTATVLEKMFLIPVKVHVAMIPFVAEKVGKAGNKAIIGGSKIYAIISQKNPSPYDPSAAKTF